MKPFKFAVCFGFVVAALTFRLAVEAGELPSPTRADVPPIPSGRFSPSQVRTLDGGLIPVEQFFPSSRCAKCHADTHAAWSESLHRNAAREPFYRESADILLRTRGIEFTRHCESCHTPVALVSGTLTKESGKTEAPFTPLDHEGVTCVVCHSIVEARLDGTGSYTIRRPALLADEDGTPRFGDFSDEQILADVPAHKRAMMRPLLRQPEFCATCHKVTAPPELNGYKQINGFSAYDEWQQSGASHESVAPFYRRDTRLDCRACHMPKIPSLNDRAAKNGLIASHRWLGANTAAPLFYGQTEQARLTQDFLENNHLSIDIFALKRGSTGETIVPLSQGPDSVVLNDLSPGEELTVEVVVANRNVAHSFPPEVRDLYEAWVEFEAIDADGGTVFHGGFVKPDGTLDERAHVYKTILLDDQARTITRHQIWLIKSKGYDNALPAGKSDLVRFQFKLPEKRSAMTLRARVNYRRLNREYTDYVLKRQNRELTPPVVRMAETTVTLSAGKEGKGKKASEHSSLIPHSSSLPTARRWNDYGIALLERQFYGEAADAFLRAAEVDPTNPDLFVNAAIAELRTERFAPTREQQQRAAELIERARAMNPESPRTRYFRALVLKAQNRLREAVEELAALVREFPRDRDARRQLGNTLLLLGRAEEAKTELDAVLTIDPNDAEAHRLLSAAFTALGRTEEARREHEAYLQWRDDPRADVVSARFFAAHPEWQPVRNRTQTYDDQTPPRPVLTGPAATPDR